MYKYDLIPLLEILFKYLLFQNNPVLAYEDWPQGASRLKKEADRARMT